MLIDYALLPPEINSARMYTGAGAGSLQAAAATWETLSADMHSTAETYGSVVSELTSLQWLGKSSVSMTAAVIPYLAWLNATAAQAEQTAIQAKLAVAAFEQAFAMTVPPPLVAANRAELLSLIATNFFGQNTAAIAANEAQYTEMWAQDATAMYDYAGTSTAAATLTPFPAPEQTTDPAGPTTQSAAVAQANTAAAIDSSTVAHEIEANLEALILPYLPQLSPVFGATNEVLNVTDSLPNIVQADFTMVDGVLASYATVNSVSSMSGMGTGLIGAEQNLGLLNGLTGSAAAAAPEELIVALNSIANAISGSGFHGAAGLGSGVSASMTSAGRIGQMSVPQAWAAPAITTVRALEGTPMTTVPLGDGPGSAMPAMAAMPAGSGRMVAVPRYGSKLTVMTRPFAGG